MEVAPVFLQKKLSLWKAFHNSVSFPERSGLLSLVSAVAHPSGIWLEGADVAWESRFNPRARWPAHRRRRERTFALLPIQLEPRLRGPPAQPTAGETLLSWGPRPHLPLPRLAPPRPETHQRGGACARYVVAGPSAGARR